MCFFQDVLSDISIDTTGPFTGYVMSNYEEKNDKL